MAGGRGSRLSTIQMDHFNLNVILQFIFGIIINVKMNKI